MYTSACIVPLNTTPIKQKRLSGFLRDLTNKAVTSLSDVVVVVSTFPGEYDEENTKMKIQK